MHQTPGPGLDAPSPHSPAMSDEASIDPDASEEGEYMYRRYLVEFVDQPELVTRPIDSKARVTHVGTDVSNLNYLVRQHYGPDPHAEDVVHYPTNRISQRYAAREPAVRLPLDAFELPSRATVDKLLEAYFRHINPGFPVIDETLFMEQYRARDPSNPPSLLLLQAMLVAGAHALYNDSHGKARRAASKAMFFRRAKILLEGQFERNRDTIVQATLLLTWHTDGLEDVTANAWHWPGLAIRTAMGLGMHRDNQRSTLVPHNKRMWRRVWWLLFISDVWVSVQYGRPQGIHLEDCTVGHPICEDFQACGPDNRPEHMIQSVRLAVIVSDVLRARARSKTVEERREALKNADEKLVEWTTELPKELHPQMSGSDVAITNLHLHYNAVLILLHRPEPSSDSNRHADDSADLRLNAEICSSAASTIQTLFQSICQSNKMKNMWLSSINCLFTALIQLRIDVRLANPLVAVSALKRFDSALSSLKELAEFWPNAQSIVHFFEHSAKAGEARNFRPNEPSAALGVHRQEVREPDSVGHRPATAPVAEDPRERISVPPRAEVQDLERARACAGAEKPSADAATGAAPRHTTACFDDGSNGTENILNAWKDWHTQDWQGELSDEFLFTF